MKILRIVLIACFVAIFGATTAFAGSGKAIVPHWDSMLASFNPINSDLYVSNITQHDLEVKITVYDKDGNIVTSQVSYENFQNNNTEVAAGKSARIIISNSSGVLEYGYAVIEWINKGSDDDAVGLIAYVKNPVIQINNGMPF